MVAGKEAALQAPRTMRSAAALSVALVLAACSREPARPGPGQIPVTTASTRALKAFLQGRDLQDKLRGAEARSFFQKAVDLDPAFALAHLGLAQTAPTPAEVFPALQRAVELAGQASAAEAHLIRAWEAGVNSRPAEQLEHLQALVAACPNDPRPLFLLGTYRYGRQEWEEAIKAYEAAVRVDPGFSPVYNQLGYALRNLNRLNDAEKAFRTYKELVPDEPNPYDSHAELLMMMGKHKEAVEEYRKALAINPNFAASYVGMGNAYMRLGDVDAARKAFATLHYLARDEGQRRQAMVWLASADILEDKYDDASRLIWKSVKAAQERNDLASAAGDLNLLGIVALETGKPDEAEALFRQSAESTAAANVTPEVKATAKHNTLYMLTRVALARSDLATAEEQTAAYCRTSEERRIPFELRRCRELRGLVALARSDAATAVAELRAAGDTDPRVLFELALAQLAAGDLEAAKSTLQRVVEFNALNVAAAFVRPRAARMLKDM